MLERALFLLCVLASSAVAQDTTVTLWTRETLSSSWLKEQRTIYVATPDGYRTSTERYPVLVILDAGDRPQFNLAIANTAFLANRGAIPNLIVVGIVNGKDRTHDMTPIATGQNAKDFPTAGGAAAFSDFIVDEVIPLVRSKYRTLPTTILAGHSFGGWSRSKSRRTTRSVQRRDRDESVALVERRERGRGLFRRNCQSGKGRAPVRHERGPRARYRQDDYPVLSAARFPQAGPHSVRTSTLPRKHARPDAGSESRRWPAIRVRAHLNREVTRLFAQPRRRLGDRNERVP